jgi:proline racemase
MYGCFVTEPEDREADLGVVFFHNEGYSTACGHGTIALVTWALDTGLVAAEEPETHVVVDVPSGRLDTVARVEGGKVRSVRFRNVPSFVLAEGLLAEGLRADVAFGGAFYASVASPLPVEPRNVPELIRLGRGIKHALEEQASFVHPEEPELRDVYGVIFWERLGPTEQRNVTVFADGEVDRSPCGSGTSARLALLDATGQLPRGERLDHRSIIDTEFTGQVVGTAEVAGRPAVITEVEGCAHLTGYHHFVLSDHDEVGTGFLLR